MIDLRQLRSFAVLAETLHFGRAAERLNLTQPPLSRQIAALEATLGTLLFERHSRSVVLTPAGQALRDGSRSVFAALEAAEEAAKAAALGASGRLQLVFSMSTAWSLLPALVRVHASAWPTVRVQLEEVVPRELALRMQRGEADAGLSFAWHHPPELSFLPLQSEPLCVVLPSRHRLARHAVVPVAKLAGEAFIGVPASVAAPLHDAVMQCCREQGFEPRMVHLAHLQQTIVNLVAAGLGIALVPDSMRKLQLAGAVFRSIDASPKLVQGIAWRADNDNPCLPGLLTSARQLAKKA